MGKSKSKSTNVFEVRMWSKDYYEKDIKPKHRINIWNGLVINKKNTKERYHFHSPVTLLQVLERLYYSEEIKKKNKKLSK